METNPAGLMRKRLAAAAASERASLAMLTELDLPDSVLEGVSSALTMRNRARGWIHSPEVDLINFECDVPAPELLKAARARHAARMRLKVTRWLRYERRHGRTHLKHANSCGNQNPVHPMGAYDGVDECGCRRPCGITGTRPGMIIMDDPHAEMPTGQARASMMAWYEQTFAGRLHAPH